MNYIWVGEMRVKQIHLLVQTHWDVVFIFTQCLSPFVPLMLAQHNCTTTIINIMCCFMAVNFVFSISSGIIIMIYSNVFRWYRGGRHELSLCTEIGNLHRIELTWYVV